LEIRLSSREIERLTRQDNRPQYFALYISSKLGDLAKKGYLTDIKLLMLETSIKDLPDYYSTADIVKNTPFPLPYAQMCKIFTLAFCLTVPFPIACVFEWFTPAPAALIAFGFFWC